MSAEACIGKGLADLDSKRRDSQVPVNLGKPGEGWHYGSPCVVWNVDKKLRQHHHADPGNRTATGVTGISASLPAKLEVEATGPSRNNIWQFPTTPVLRHVFGQSDSRLRRDDRKSLLVDLSEGRDSTLLKWARTEKGAGLRQGIG